MWPITLSTTKDAFRCYLRPINLKAAALFNSSARRSAGSSKRPGPTSPGLAKRVRPPDYYAIVISNGFIIVVAVVVAVRLGARLS